MIRSLLSEQFDECFDRNGWFVAIDNAIEGVTAEQAAWKPDGADNSIWEILTHLTYYNNAYLQRFKGIDYEYEKSDNDETFETTQDQSENDWKIEIERFDSTMSEWRELLAASDERRGRAGLDNKRFLLG